MKVANSGASSIQDSRCVVNPRQPVRCQSKTAGALSINSPGKLLKRIEDEENVSVRIAEIERRRIALRLSQAKLCRLAEVDQVAWQRIRTNKQKPRQQTLVKLEAALGGAAPRPTSNVIKSYLLTVMRWLAEKTGHDPEIICEQDFSAERPNIPIWLAAARLRRMAMYILTVELQIGNAELARAIGCSRQNVKQARDSVEDIRAAPHLDALLERAAQLVRGRLG
jgi:transcriptional regulator with XRE-family HTH domain